MPAGWFNTTSNLQITLFGPEIFQTGDPTVANFFTKIRTLSTYFLWAGFILSVYSFGQYFYWKHLNSQNKKY